MDVFNIIALYWSWYYSSVLSSGNSRLVKSHSYLLHSLCKTRLASVSADALNFCQTTCSELFNGNISWLSDLVTWHASREILQLGYRKNVVDRGISMDNLPTLLGSQGFWTINTRSLSRCCRSHTPGNLSARCRASLMLKHWRHKRRHGKRSVCDADSDYSRPLWKSSSNNPNRDPIHYLRNPENGFMEPDCLCWRYWRTPLHHIRVRGCLARNFSGTGSARFVHCSWFSVVPTSSIQTRQVLGAVPKLEKLCFCVSLVWSEVLPYHQNHGFLVSIVLVKKTLIKK